MDKTVKEKRLQILSLAMDINEKYGAICFVKYFPHVDAIEVYIYNTPSMKYENGYNNLLNAYGDERCVGLYNNVTHDHIITTLQDILENGLKKQ